MSTVRSSALLVLFLGAGCAASGAGPRAVLVTPRPAAQGPRVLCVCAHPDDETAFAATLYKITTHLDGACDLVTITNGEGGFKYSTLAEPLYGLELTDEPVGRAHLPGIRERELIEGLGYLGLRRLYLLDERDHRYTLDPLEVLAPDARVWDLEAVAADLDAILARGDYDFVLTLAPVPETHGHHQAATILALEALARMPAPERPAVLAARTRELGQEPAAIQQQQQQQAWPITHLRPRRFSFDRTQALGFGGRLDYRIVVNWVIAAHKSQGTMQLYMGRGAFEDFHLFELSGPGAEERTAALFEALAEPQFEAREYGASAGTNAVGSP